MAVYAILMAMLVQSDSFQPYCCKFAETLDSMGTVIVKQCHDLVNI